jgi:CheY-like chemotaxis protein
MPRLLIVDDDSFTRSVLENVLLRDPQVKGLGLEVLSAEDGEKGVALFEQHRPQFVVVDLLMPKMDGFALCKAIRSKPGGSEVHLMAVSGVYRETALASKLQKEHNARFFAKPYQIKDLTRHIATLLRGEMPEAEAGGSQGPKVPTSGDLSARPLPALLLDFLDARATGRLKLRRIKMEKEIGLVVGHPVNVTSNVRAETLGHFLRSQGLINETQHNTALARASARGERIGAALIALGAINPEQLLEQLTKQARFKLRETLRWPDGEWKFEASSGSPSGPHGDAIDMTEVVLDGLRKTVQIAPLPPHLNRLLETPLSLNQRGETLRAAVSRYLCPRFDEVWEQGKTAQLLLDDGLDRLTLFTALDALWMCRGLDSEAMLAEPAAPTAMQEDQISLGLLSTHAERARTSDATEEVGGVRAGGDELYDMLFGEEGGGTGAGALPIEFPDATELDLYSEDSGVVELRPSGPAPPPPPITAVGGKLTKASGQADEGTGARRELLREFLRIQDVSHYDVLLVPNDANAGTICAALAERRSKYSFEFFSRYDLGRDYAKLEEIHAAYDRAGKVLLDDDARRVYDGDTAGALEPTKGVATLDAELAFYGAEELIAKRDYRTAIEKLTFAVAAAPNEASYHAMLGWVRFLAGRRSALAADAARPHINRALAIDPESLLAHEYKGIITAEVGGADEEAILHLEHALHGDPSRLEALAALERLRTSRGELRPLERVYRKLIYRAAERDSALELALWRKLERLCREELDDPESARVAVQSALRLAPDDTELKQALAALEGKAAAIDQNAQPVAPRKRLRAGPEEAYLTASLRIAEGRGDRKDEDTYQKYRYSHAGEFSQMLDDRLWAELAHPDDSRPLGQLFALLEPILDSSSTLHLAGREIGEALPIEEVDVPPVVARMRARAARLLGVAEPRIYARSDFGREIHLAATLPPVLLAGDEALSSPERAELGFRMGRALTYLKPGRALGGSQPGNFLKRVFVAAWTSAAPSATQPGAPDLADLIEPIQRMPSEQLAELRRLVETLTQRSGALNLSRWQRALGRTADRVGLLLCGDLPSAVRFLRDGAPLDAVRDLIEFARSSTYRHMREALGLELQAPADQ